MKSPPSSISKTLSAMRKLLSPLVGEHCWKCRIGIGGELKIEVGPAWRSKASKAAHVRYGTWSIRSRGSQWTLSSPLGNTRSDAPPDEIGEALRRLENRRISGVTVSSMDVSLVVTFEESAVLTIAGPSVGDASNDMEAWLVVFTRTPRNLYLAVGPGRGWSFSEGGRRLPAVRASNKGRLPS